MMKKLLYILCLFVLLMLASTAFAEIKIKHMYGSDFVDYCYLGDLEKVKEGLSLGANVNYVIEDKEDKGLTPLIAAILSKNHSQNRIEIIKLLIEAGANVNSNQFNSGLTPLLIALTRENALEILEIFLNAGADVNYVVKDDQMQGFTPLILGLLHEHLSISIVNRLIEAGANVR